MAFFDATNTTHARREYLIERFHGKVQYLFLENICDDSEVLEKNIQLKLMHSDDYATMDHDQVRRLQHQAMLVRLCCRSCHTLAS